MHAWHTVAFYTHVKAKGKLPDVKQFLSGGQPSESTEGQSLGQQRGVLAILSAQYGYPVKWGKAKKKATT